ncbi:protein translocase subunit SecD [Candidatus Falkowbacteria bacterium]|nr:protein translocase subunit SecD [Candidatus Falkowbacteria bacterium]
MQLSQIGKIRLSVLGVLLVALLAGFLVYPAVFNTPAHWLNNKLGLVIPDYWRVPFRLGLDLQGGTHLVYQADTSQIPSGEKAEAVQGVRDVIERRVNAFGVAEPVVQVSGSGENIRIVAELAGVSDVNQAIAMIGETPLLEFKEQGTPQPLTPEQEKTLADYNAAAKKKAQDLLKQALNAPMADFAALAQANSEDPGSAAQGGDLGWAKRGAFVAAFDKALFDDLKVGQITAQLVQTDFGYHIIYKEEQRGEGEALEVKSRHLLIKTKTAADIQPAETWEYTGLTGKQLEKAQVQFDSNTGAPTISLQFDSEGTDLFAAITKRNVGKPVAIFLDGQIISSPRVNEEIPSGQAVISGTFTLPEAKQLVRDLNSGALPVPVTLISQQTVGATLGADSVEKSLFAGLVGLLAIAVFMILYYRLPGLLSVVALMIYGILVLTIFKLVGVTLTLAGIAGFILSLGMAVDANVLIFERMKEEFRAGRPLGSAIDEGFKRAWPSIRDGNLSTLITCAILFWFTTSLIKGFALTLTIGILVSIFTAITVTRGFLKSIARGRVEQWYFLFHRKKAKVQES